jgi:hypothetical protein
VVKFERPKTWTRHEESPAAALFDTLDLPPMFVKMSHIEGRQLEVVGDESQFDILLFGPRDEKRLRTLNLEKSCAMRLSFTATRRSSATFAASSRSTNGS